jgi:hypothetical protein
MQYNVREELLDVAIYEHAATTWSRLILVVLLLGPTMSMINDTLSDVLSIPTGAACPFQMTGLAQLLGLGGSTCRGCGHILTCSLLLGILDFWEAWCVEGGPKGKWPCTRTIDHLSPRLLILSHLRLGPDCRE